MKTLERRRPNASPSEVGNASSTGRVHEQHSGPGSSSKVILCVEFCGARVVGRRDSPKAFVRSAVVVWIDTLAEVIRDAVPDAARKRQAMLEANLAESLVTIPPAVGFRPLDIEPLQHALRRQKRVLNQPDPLGSPDLSERWRDIASPPRAVF